MKLDSFHKISLRNPTSVSRKLKIAAELCLAEKSPHASSIAVMSYNLFQGNDVMILEEIQKYYVESDHAFGFLAAVPPVIGYAGYILVNIHPEQLVIRQIGVLPQYRRKGIGSQLVTNVMDISGENGFDVICRINEMDKVAWQFFRACGLYGSQLLRAMVPGGRDEYLMSSVEPKKVESHAGRPS